MDHNIRIVLDTHPDLKKGKTRQLVIKQAKLTDTQLSRFVNFRGGLDAYALTRLLLAMGCRIIDKNNKVIIGDSANNPEILKAQIEENTLG